MDWFVFQGIYAIFYIFMKRQSKQKNLWTFIQYMRLFTINIGLI